MTLYTREKARYGSLPTSFLVAILITSEYTIGNHLPEFYKFVTLHLNK